ncbi:hypothetical protein M9978_16625 [Sphingomonas sp. MG17]|uniref:Uncharacterized protein n=1 Tax=Sphingomonas tagetis TaxID=2949092 RepID=A0A9X2HP97_9SPHN|nr:hypothetical protein [Sphingomonas tagetis]MCP3732051.1 hypothetical protein [Sphingomonas tagetis]
MTGIRLAASNDPVDAAWAAFDAAAIRFKRMYDRVERLSIDHERAARMEAAQEVARLWDEWRALYLAASGDDEPRPAA